MRFSLRQVEEQDKELADCPAGPELPCSRVCRSDHLHQDVEVLMRVQEEVVTEERQQRLLLLTLSI
eukprot:759319-Hanusia_phi.AAC.4